MWHCKTGHFLGFFGQTKSWTLSSEMLIPPSPVQPSDITEVLGNLAVICFRLRYYFPSVADEWKSELHYI